MTQISTVTGPTDSSQLGRVLIHEHVFIAHEEYQQNYRADWVEEVKIAKAVRELQDLKASGIDTILDPTVLGLGRFIHRVRQVAEQVDLRIVPATGLYTYRDLPNPFLFYGPGLPFSTETDPLVDIFVKDLTVGIADTDIKAAFLKCAIAMWGLTEGVERAMRAVGRASVATGAPVTVHTDPELRTGLVAQRVLREEGVDLRRVIIGHSGDSTDLDYLMEIADAGSILGMDRFGNEGAVTFDQRIDTIVRLVERGYSDRIGLSHDNFSYCDFYPEGEPGNKYSPEISFLLVSRQVVPALLERGVTQSQIDQMLIENPRRYFEI